MVRGIAMKKVETANVIKEQVFQATEHHVETLPTQKPVGWKCGARANPNPNGVIARARQRRREKHD
jgi:hypothetical protein